MANSTSRHMSKSISLLRSLVKSPKKSPQNVYILAFERVPNITIENPPPLDLAEEDPNQLAMVLALKTLLRLTF
jgi:hypothetical protein